MRINEIRVEGFGALRDRTLRLEGPATVLYGPNEAGKSTLLQLIRAVLFGFVPRSQGGGRFEPEDGGAHGGSLLLELDSGEQVRVARRSGDGAGGRGRSPSSGLVTVTMPDGSLGGEELLRGLLNGVSAEQFRNLFAFTLTELQELRTLTSEELGSYLHSAGLGVRASAVTETERRLAQELEARFRPRGRNQGISRLLAEADQLEAAWRRSLAEAGRYDAMAGETAALETRIAGAEERLAALRQRTGFLRKAIGLRERWARRSGLLRELAALPEHEGFPAQGLTRQEELLRELEQAAARLSRLQSRREELERTAVQCGPREVGLLAQREALQALSGEYRLYQAGFGQEAELRQELHSLEQQLERRLAELGMTFTGWKEALEAPALTLGGREKAGRIKSMWEELALRRSRVQAELTRGGQVLAQEEERAGELSRLAEQLAEELSHRFGPQAELLAIPLTGLIRELRRELQQAESTSRELAAARERELEHRLALEQLQAQAGGGREAAGSPSRSLPAAVLAVAGMCWGLAAGSGLLFGLRGQWLAAIASLLLLSAAGILLPAVWPNRERTGSRRTSRSARPWSADGTVSPHEAGDSAEPPGFTAASRRRLELEQEESARRHKAEEWVRQIGAQLVSAQVPKEVLVGLNIPVGRHSVLPDAIHPGDSVLKTPLSDISLPDAGYPDRLEQWLSELGQELARKAQLDDKRAEAVKHVRLQLLQLEKLEEELVELDRESVLLLEDWRDWLAQWNVDKTDLTPGMAAEFMSGLEQVRDLASRLSGVTGRLERIWEERAAYEDRAAALLDYNSGIIPESAVSACSAAASTALSDESSQAAASTWCDESPQTNGTGEALVPLGESIIPRLWGLSGQELGPALQVALREAEEAARKLERRSQALEELEPVQAELRQDQESAARCQIRLEALWQQAGAVGEEEFRRYGAERERREALERELQGHHEWLAAAVGEERLEELERLLADSDLAGVEEELHRQEEEMGRLSSQLDGWKEEKGRLVAETSRLLEGYGHGELQDKREDLLARFSQDVSEWAVLSMAAGLLRKAKSVYERERQPAVLKQASEHLARMTGGRYSRIVAPVGEERLYAMRPDGQSLDSARLSRGTAEQLYLALRFALVREFAKRASLPLVMDDIFVNFDRSRLELAAEELALISNHHQILLFTCHHHVLETIQAAIPGVQTVMLQS